jgi:Sir2- and TIR-associating SLOG family
VRNLSGFGLGVGPYVLNGLLQELEKQGTRVLDDRVVLRPFPIAITDPAERKLRWTSYREDMLTQAGVALFVFGNKRNSAGGISPADGMEEEFRIAVQKKLFVVPVGCTGGMAATLHQRVLDNFDEYYRLPGYKKLFEALGLAGTPAQVTLRTLKLVKKLWGDRALAREK